MHEKLFSTISHLEETGLTKTTEDQLCSENDVQLMEFRRVSEKDIMNTVIKSPTKHCDLDPIPTSLLKDILKSIALLLQEITNINHIWSIPTRFQGSTSKLTHQENNFGSFKHEELLTSLQAFF